MEARKLFAAARGIAGAALGVYLTLRLCTGLLVFLWERQLGTSLLVLGPVLLCPAAYLGYWCFRGLRHRRFACTVVWGCAFLALPLTVRPDMVMGWLEVCLLSALSVVFSRLLGREGFLRYVDPAWYRDPRRVAARYGGGRSPNRCGPEAGAGLLVPDAFAVNEGGGGPVLYVRETVLRWEPRLAKGRTFFIGDVAGVLVGPACNVLYDARSQDIAWFRTSQKNGPLLARHLRDRGIPFYSLGEVPKQGPLPGRELPTCTLPSTPDGSERLAEPEEAEPVRHTDISRSFSRDFTLELRRTKPVGVWIAVGLLLGLAVFFVGFPFAVIRGGPYENLKLNVMLVLSCGLIAGPWVLAAAAGELFSPRLSVENGHIWLDKDFFPLREIPMEEIGGLRWDQSDECYVLCDRQNKALAKFSTRDGFGSQFLNFLTDHGITLSK